MMHSSPSQHIEAILPLPCRSLPFRKSSLMWGSIEFMEVFKVLPQQPHLCPLEQYNEEAREGIAIGKMLIFANLVKETMELQLDVPRSIFKSKLEVLTDIEDCGFTVQPIRSRFEEFLRIKDSYNELFDNAKTVEREVHEEKLKYDELQEFVHVLMVDKETKGHSVTGLQRTVDAIMERIQGAMLDFNRLDASPW
ncbi:hypothetical protein IFM89_004354 [Coptis chinensis]|uniref:Uncharacterized protein n=1 Tax=Coptis chinensis TaxID=261450 RepID=A0A835LYG2_9MAGN|nr:hypothetical protein IFM89_004354 [Coptis chinensis]